MLKYSCCYIHDTEDIGKYKLRENISFDKTNLSLSFLSMYRIVASSLIDWNRRTRSMRRNNYRLLLESARSMFLSLDGKSQVYSLYQTSGTGQYRTVELPTPIEDSCAP